MSTEDVHCGEITDKYLWFSKYLFYKHLIYFYILNKLDNSELVGCVYVNNKNAMIFDN